MKKTRKTNKRTINDEKEIKELIHLGLPALFIFGMFIAVITLMVYSFVGFVGSSMPTCDKNEEIQLSTCGQGFGEVVVEAPYFGVVKVYPTQADSRTLVTGQMSGDNYD